jgi:hypothetical protein
LLILEAFIALEKRRPDGHHNTMAIAERLCDAGRHSEALEWVRKRGRPGLKVMTYDNLADGSRQGTRCKIVVSLGPSKTRLTGPYR